MFFFPTAFLWYTTHSNTLGPGLGCLLNWKKTDLEICGLIYRRGIRGLALDFFSKSNFRVLWPSLVAILWEASHIAATGPVGPGALGEGRWHPQIMTEIYSSYLWFHLNVRIFQTEIVFSSILKQTPTKMFTLSLP